MSDISDLFKDNEHKLHEAPPEQVWNRLEERLEKSKPTRRRGRIAPMMQPLALVLTVLLMLLAAIVVWWYVKNA